MSGREVDSNKLQHKILRHVKTSLPGKDELLHMTPTPTKKKHSLSWAYPYSSLRCVAHVFTKLYKWPPIEGGSPTGSDVLPWGLFDPHRRGAGIAIAMTEALV